MVEIACCKKDSRYGSCTMITMHMIVRVVHVVIQYRRYCDCGKMVLQYCTRINTIDLHKCVTSNIQYENELQFEFTYWFVISNPTLAIFTKLPWLGLPVVRPEKIKWI